MANLVRVRTIWTGSGVVGPGVSTFYWDEADTGFVTKINAFWTSMVTSIAGIVTLTTPGSGDLIDVATGQISGTWTDGGTLVTNTTATGAYAAGVGARVSWATSGIRNGRRVRGSTFVVPLISACFAIDGTLDPTKLTSLRGSASTLVTAAAGHMRVYSKPNAAGAGQSNTVISSDVADTVSWLRTRRT